MVPLCLPILTTDEAPLKMKTTEKWTFEALINREYTCRMLLQVSKVDNHARRGPCQSELFWKQKAADKGNRNLHNRFYEPSKLSFFDVIVIVDVPFSRMSKQGFRHVWTGAIQCRRRSQPRIKLFYCLSTFTEEQAIWNKLTINQELQLPQIDQKIGNNNAVTSRVLPGFALIGSCSDD